MHKRAWSATGLFLTAPAHDSANVCLLNNLHRHRPTRVVEQRNKKNNKKNAPKKDCAGARRCTMHTGKRDVTMHTDKGDVPCTRVREMYHVHG